MRVGEFTWALRGVPSICGVIVIAAYLIIAHKMILKYVSRSIARELAQFLQLPET
jgi:hypothetical protein